MASVTPRPRRQACIPSWVHPVRNARARGRKLGQIHVPGCRVREGVIPCDPNGMRAYTEGKLRDSGLLPPFSGLSMDAYILARNVRSEAGIGSIPEKVAMAEAGVNHARNEGVSIARGALKRTSQGLRFGEQSGSNPRVSTRQDPTYEDIVIAELVLRGDTENYVRGATNYFSPNTQDALHRQGRVRFNRFELYDRWTRRGLAWVGPIPGINHHEQFLLREVDRSTPQGAAYWSQMRDAGLGALRSADPPSTVRAEPCSSFFLGSSAVTTIGMGLAVSASLVFFLGMRFGDAEPYIDGNPFYFWR